MDLKSKGITWVGSIYQRFESVCQEVDSLMAQEKVKYVKRQVQASCENVQKLYAETVQDLIPFAPADSVKGYRYISEMFEGEKSKVGSEEFFKDERLSSSSQSEGIAFVDKDSSAIPSVDSCSTNENTLLHCKVEASVSSDKDSSPIPLVNSCSANESVSLHSQLEAHVDSCSVNENVSLHSQLVDSTQYKDSNAALVDSWSLQSHLEAGISLDNDSHAIPCVDSCSLYSQLEASNSLNKDSNAIPLVDSFSLHSHLETSTVDKESNAIPLVGSCSLDSHLEASTSLSKDSHAIPLADSCSLDSHLEPVTSLSKDSHVIPLVDSCSLDSLQETITSLDKDSRAILHMDSCSLDSQVEAGTSLDKDSTAIPLVDSCSLHSQLEASTSLDKDSTAIPLMDSCSLDSQLEANTSLDKESIIIPLVDSCSANENSSLHHQFETSVSMDKDSSVNACSPNESMLLHSQFEASISLNEDPVVPSPRSGRFLDEELYLPFHSKSNVSMDDVSTAASLLGGMPNQPEACDTMMESNRVLIEDTEKYYTQGTVENDSNSDVVSYISEGSNVPLNELVIPVAPHEEVLEHGLMLLTLGSSTNLTDSSTRANPLETCIATEETTQCPTEVVGQNCSSEAGGNDNVSYEASSIDYPSNILQSNLVLEDVSHRETVDDKSITSNCVSSLSIDFAGSSASTLHNGSECANHTESCTTLAEESIRFSEVSAHESLERAEEKSALSDASVEDTCRSPNETSQMESLDKKCEKDSKNARIRASLQPTDIAVSTSSNSFDCEKSSKRVAAVGLNSVTEEEFEDVTLDDDFVDPEAQNDEAYLITLLASRKRSYKEKLQDALLSRIRTSKRDDCEEIIAWYRDFNKSSKQRKNLKEMKLEDCTESDWELV